MEVLHQLVYLCKYITITNIIYIDGMKMKYTQLEAF